MSDAPKQSEKKSSSSSWKWIITWLMIFALAGFVVWQMKRADKIESAHMIALQDSLNNQMSDSESVLGLLKTHEAQINTLAEHYNEMVTSIQSMSAFMTGNTQAWMLAQTQQYLEMAVVQAVLLNDPQVAISLLDAADLNLEQINNPNLLGVRKAIATDRNNLASMNTTNKESVIIALNTLAEETPKLKQILQAPSKAADTTPDENASTTANWQASLNRTWKELKSLVRIRKHDQNLTPYHPLEQHELLDENLQLMLRQAAFSVTRGEQSLYMNNLENAQAWLKTYYDQEDPNVLASLKVIRKLLEQNIAVNTPEHFASVDAWREFVKAQAQGQAQPPAQSPQETSAAPAPAEAPAAEETSE